MAVGDQYSRLRTGHLRYPFRAAGSAPKRIDSSKLDDCGTVSIWLQFNRGQTTGQELRVIWYDSCTIVELKLHPKPSMNMTLYLSLGPLVWHRDFSGNPSGVAIGLKFFAVVRPAMRCRC